MATLQALRDRVRLELADPPQDFSTTASGDGVTKRFELPYQPLQESTLKVFTGGTPAQPDAYAVDVQTGVLTFEIAPAPGVLITTTGKAFKYFTDTTINTFINTAFLQHTHNRNVSMATLPPVEDYLIALLATVEGLFVLLTDATYDIDIMTPEGITIPRSQRRAALMEMVQTRQMQYKDLAAALNVGLNRIEMFDLRRVSRTTGKLVAQYVEQEFDDISPPRRVFNNIDTKGGVPAKDSVAVYNIRMIEAEPYFLDLDLETLVGKTVRADIRPYPNAARLLSFQVTVLDEEVGTVRLELNPQSVRRLGAGPRFYDVRITDNATRVSRTVLRGEIEIEQRAL